MKKHNKYILLGFKALQRAATKVAENARKIIIKYQFGIMVDSNMKYQKLLSKPVHQTPKAGVFRQLQVFKMLL